MIGEAVSSSAHRTLSLAPAIRSAKANTTRNTAPNQTRGSVSRLWPNSACGTPNAAISGRYGLYWLGLVVLASACELRYGVPSLMSVVADGGHDADLGFPVAVGDHPEQREQDGAAEHHAERDVDAAGSP